MKSLGQANKLHLIIIFMSVTTIIGAIAVIVLAVAVSNALPTSTTFFPSASTTPVTQSTIPSNASSTASFITTPSSTAPTTAVSFQTSTQTSTTASVPPSSPSATISSHTSNPSTSTSIFTSSSTSTPSPTLSISSSSTPAPAAYPCTKDVLILIDVSNAIGIQENFDAQLHFITFVLASNWSVSCTQVEACPCVYDAQTFIRLAAFDSANLTDLQSSIIDAKSYYNNDTKETPSIHVGLELGMTEQSFRNGIKKVTLLFTSSSDPTDVNNSLGYAADLKRNGNTLVVIGMGPNANKTVLTPLASGPNFAFASPSFAALANNSDLASQVNAAMCWDAPMENIILRPQKHQTIRNKALAPSDVKYSERRPTPCVQ